jgi:DoxX-like family
MNPLLWILSFALAATYAITGSAKVASSRERLLAVPGMGWVEETPTSRVRTIGLLEIAGAIGVVVPWATGILPLLTPLAALGLAAVQMGAMATHLTRGEREHLWLNVLLLVVAVVVAIGRVVA